MRIRAFAALPLLFGLTAATAFAGQAGPQPLLVHAASLQWQDAPAFQPGAKVAMVYGDMSKPGPFVARLSMPAGYKIAPHWHSKDELLTVLSGHAHVGMGETFDLAHAQAVDAGDFAFMPAGNRHFLQSDEPTVVQINGVGPFDINYVNPADDPRVH